MDSETYELERQIERCRRLASIMTDDDVRHSLEQLAREYEAQRPQGFMLRTSEPVS
jgi:hypothetical protein